MAWDRLGPGETATCAYCGHVHHGDAQRRACVLRARDGRTFCDHNCLELQRDIDEARDAAADIVEEELGEDRYGPDS